MKLTHRKQSGLTLIELMVTIAIVGILAAIAIPSYSYYTLTTKRSAAKSSLQQVRGLLEQYYTNDKVYTTNLTDLGFQNSPLEINKTGDEVAAGSSDIVYEIAIHTGAAIAYCSNCDYEVVATAKNTQTKDTNCAIFWFSSLGQKGSVKNGGGSSTGCW